MLISEPIIARNMPDYRHYRCMRLSDVLGREMYDHLICNQGATGSNPVAGTININDLWEKSARVSGVFCRSGNV